MRKLGRLGPAVAIVVVASCSAQPSPPSTSQPAGPTAIPPSVTPVAPSPTPGRWLTLGPYATDAAWSPDGRHLLVWRNGANTTGDPANLWVDLPDGTTVQTLAGIGGRGAGFAGALWIDNTTFLAGDNGRNVIGAVGSNDLQPFMPLVDVAPISNGRGVLAYDTTEPYEGGAEYAVWTPTGSTPPHAGSPVAWSHDGTKLVVWHWTGGDSPRSLSGWVEIVGWPGLSRVAAWKSEDVGPDPGSLLFDPSDRYFYSAGRVHDLRSGTIVSVPFTSGVFNGAAWTSLSQIVTMNEENLHAIGYDVTGQVAFETGDVGVVVAASADGATLAFWGGGSYPEQRPITLRRATGEHSIEVPVPFSSVLLSPDGTGVVVRTDFEPLLLRP